METPSTADWVRPQEFHGISTEVTETESSRLRLSILGCKDMRSYTFLYMLAPIIKERYWSAVNPLSSRPLPMVAPTAPRRLRIFPVIHRDMDSIMRVPIITPPKTMALRTRNIVGSIPMNPDVDTRSLNARSGVSNDRPWTSIVMTEASKAKAG